jgi:hypothetical protein
MNWYVDRGTASDAPSLVRTDLVVDTDSCQVPTLERIVAGEYFVLPTQGAPLGRRDFRAEVTEQRYRQEAWWQSKDCVRANAAT